MPNKDRVWTIELGKRIGPFCIGSSIIEALHVLENRVPIHPLEITYDGMDPYKNDTVIDSPEEGFQCYHLSYEGGSVKFPIPIEHQDFYKDQNDLPLAFPNGSTPIACGLTVFSGSNQYAPCVPKPIKCDYGEIVNVHIYPSAATLLFCDKKASLELGWTPQQVISSIGQPISVFRKAEDPNPGSVVMRERVNEYFHNYPHLGCDVMYNSLHKVSKIILRTNVLGHPEFGTYHKSNFRIYIHTVPGTATADVLCESITPETTWEQIQKSLSISSKLRPVIHDSGLGLHPFGSSYCYAPVPDCIFEVLKNGYLASVTIVQT
ncbi:unnamed protein product [Albugo candida]|uniref:Uncharacterized protein n=1 Tax=Albugo candida TaxID=65357 RepID=A0A024GEU9_9STRA|nr:unnamed protein product [Albugo candida]|eukprot:CCI45227.1 unnamed protein product [Albugo candida]